MICSICNKKILGDDHNALPVALKPCCDKCNINVVIPIRLFELDKKNYGLIINTEYKTRLIRPKDLKFSLKELQDMVEGYIEIYPSNNKNIKILVNEDGRIMRLPINKFASNMYGIHALGNVVIIPNELFK